MFDIREYYNCSGASRQGIDSEILEIDTDLASDIDILISDKKGSLYITDRYKNRDFSIDIIYPELGYPGNQTLIMTPDRLRFLLSFYPYKGDLEKVEKIVLRPRYVEAGNIELAALYLKKKKILVLYLTHPGGQSGERSIVTCLHIIHQVIPLIHDKLKACQQLLYKRLFTLRNFTAIYHLL